jgi:hypothetical protein
MKIRHFFLLAVAGLVAVGALARAASFPVAPFVIVMAFGELLLAFQVEHHKLGRFLRVLGHEFKTDHAARMRHVH